MNHLLELEDEKTNYLSYPGPFTDLPSSLLEDLLVELYDRRSLPKEMLHQLILPQLEVCPSVSVTMFDYHLTCCRATLSSAAPPGTFRPSFSPNIVRN